MPVDTNTPRGQLSTGLGLVVFFAALAIYVGDLLTLWNGYPFETILDGTVLLNAFRIFLPILLASALFMYRKVNNKQEIISKWALDYVWILIGGIALNNIMSLMHLAFSLLIFHLFKEFAGEDKAGFINVILVLTLFDFFGFAALKGGINLFGAGLSSLAFSRIMIPIWIYFTLIFCQEHNGHSTFSWLFFILVLVNVVVAFDGITLIRNSQVEEMDRSMVTEFFASFASGLEGIKQIFNMTYWTQTNPGYEEETENPQGVYLEALDSEDQVFSEGSPVYLWANIEARTLDVPIEVRVNCSVETDEGVVEGIVNPTTGEHFIDIPVYGGVDRAISCMFEELPYGDYDVKFIATFDFAADVYKKIYLMDRTRYINDQKALKAKGVDPSGEAVLKSYGIKNTNPEAIYTSGPIEVGLGAQQVPWDIDPTNNNIRPYFGVSVKNQWNKGGKILSINNIYLKIPDTFFIQDLDKSCGVKVESTSEQSESGYKTYKIVNPITNIEDEKTVNCLLYVGADSLDNVPVTTRNLKAHVDYSYLLEEYIPLEITKLPGSDEEVLVSNRVCCKVSGTSATIYKWASNSQACIDMNSNSIKAEIASTSSLCQEEICCEVIKNGEPIGRKFVTSGEECTLFGEQNQGTGILLPAEDSYLCG